MRQFCFIENDNIITTYFFIITKQELLLNK